MAKKKKAGENLEKVTTGLEPIVGEGPTLEIEGREYSIRRLGIADTFAILKLVSIGAAKAAELVDVGNLTGGMFVTALIAAIPFAENDIFKILASIIGVTVEDLRNPDLFPMGSEVLIIEALAEHQDLKAFFTHMQRLAKSSPAVQQLMQETQ